jgi:tRNA-binding protein
VELAANGELHVADGSIGYADFARVDMRAGRIVQIEDFPRARTPSYRVVVDFGPELGTKTSSFQAAAAYAKEELLDTVVVAVVNMPPRNVAGFMSEVLILGVPAEDGSLSLLRAERGAAPGARVH